MHPKINHTSTNMIQRVKTIMLQVSNYEFIPIVLFGYFDNVIFKKNGHPNVMAARTVYVTLLLEVPPSADSLNT